MYDISVIVPIFNAEKYLDECITSLINQTKDKIQIVLVNDGSTDRSPEIAESYKREYSNITVIHQENCGVELARAIGYRNAQGKYIGWIDADDIAKPEMYEKLYDLALHEGADFVYCDYDFFPKRISTKTKWFKEYKGVVDGEFIDRNTQCWNTLVDRHLYEKVHIDKCLLEYSEYCWIAAMLAAEKISYTKEKLYLYRVGQDSMSGGSYIGKIPHYRRGVEITKNLKEMIKGTKYETALDVYFDYRYIYTLILLLTVAAKNNDRRTYNETKRELLRIKYWNNPYLDTFVTNNYGKMKSFVITRILPLDFLVAREITKWVL